ncbi:ubiquitin-conjugating enzyme E2 J2-like [Diadema setosum]|uniref:ubiquitin-conjugating enzyme E2 J2-like n=1 Tax=Diadema antillarum TaxID=105358 RepID=UPI003A860834
MSTKRVNTTAAARLKQDYMRLKKDPVPYVTAEPLPSNILEWHYVVRGPKDTPYEGGVYHGKLVFPREFPFKPPSIYMITPNGRFKVNTRLCLSISDFHPDTWNPAWSVSTILTGLLSFMVEKNPTWGSIETTDFVKKQFAHDSGAFNIKNTTFVELFPDVAQEIAEALKKEEAEMKQRAESGSPQATDHHQARQRTNNFNGQPDHAPGIVGSTMANVLVIIGFAAFAWTVKYVLRSIANTDQ